MGTSEAIQTVSDDMTDHPHAYGDKVLSVSVTSLPPGSSPRVWGQVKEKGKNTLFVRIIPTRMGTS